MSEIYPDPERAKIARSLRRIVVPPSEPVRIHPSDLVVELENSERYSALSLTETGVQMSGGYPRHWRILVPASDLNTGFSAIEFGPSARADAQGDIDISRMTHEFFLDENIISNEDRDPAVSQLFSQIGGFAVSDTRDAGHPIMAAMEIRYRPTPHDTKMWAHLFFSKALLNTHSYVELDPNDNYPTWKHQIADPAYRYETAISMALSAFSAHRRSK